MELEVKAAEATICTGLPVQARWTIDGTPLDFDFSVARAGLHRLPEDSTNLLDSHACDLLVFGEQDFAEGGGARPWLCICKRTRFVWGFDLERDKPTFLLNSSIERFIATFRFLHQFLANNEQLPSDCDSCLRSFDPEVYPRSEWRLLVESLNSD